MEKRILRSPKKSSLSSLSRSLLGSVESLFSSSKRETTKKMDAIPEASPQHHKKPKLNHPSDIASVTNNQKELTDEIYPHNSLNSNITYPIKCGVPLLIVYFVNEIEKRGLDVKGLYRASGSDKDIKILKQKLHKHEEGRVPDLSDVNIHVLCSQLKNYIRKETSCIPQNYLVKLIDILKCYNEIPKLFCQVITELPIKNRNILAFIILHLKRVAKSSICNMGHNNLAIVFGPTIIHIPNKCLTEMYVQSTLAIKVMLEFFKLPESFWFNVLKPELKTMAPNKPLKRSASVGTGDVPKWSNRFRNATSLDIQTDLSIVEPLTRGPVNKLRKFVYQRSVDKMDGDLIKLDVYSSKTQTSHVSNDSLKMDNEVADNELFSNTGEKIQCSDNIKVNYVLVDNIEAENQKPDDTNIDNPKDDDVSGIGNIENVLKIKCAL